MTATKEKKVWLTLGRRTKRDSEVPGSFVPSDDLSSLESSRWTTTMMCTESPRGEGPAAMYRVPLEHTPSPRENMDPKSSSGACVVVAEVAREV